MLSAVQLLAQTAPLTVPFVTASWVVSSAAVSAKEKESPAVRARPVSVLLPCGVAETAEAAYVLVNRTGFEPSAGISTLVRVPASFL